MSDGRGLQELSPSLGMKRRDFAWLRWSPLAGPSSSTILRALSRSFGVPHRVPSSRYQTLIFKLGTSSLIRSIMGWRVRAKPRGPRGSPCWTPLWLRIVCSPLSTGPGWPSYTVPPQQHFWLVWHLFSVASPEGPCWASSVASRVCLPHPKHRTTVLGCHQPATASVWTSLASLFLSRTCAHL